MADIMTPALGESVTEATVARWAKKAGDAVRKDEILVELETDLGLEPLDRHPGEQVVEGGAVVGRTAQHVEEQGEPHAEGGGGGQDAQPVAEAVQSATAQQEHGSSGQG